MILCIVTSLRSWLLALNITSQIAWCTTKWIKITQSYNKFKYSLRPLIPMLDVSEHFVLVVGGSNKFPAIFFHQSNPFLPCRRKWRGKPLCHTVGNGAAHHCTTWHNDVSCSVIAYGVAQWCVTPLPTRGRKGLDVWIFLLFVSILPICRRDDIYELRHALSSWNIVYHVVLPSMTWSNFLYYCMLATLST
jgi:hypothetical protein